MARRSKSAIRDLVKAFNEKDKIALQGSHPLWSTIPGRVSTGSTLLDLATGGGLPRGRIYEIMGWESLGKSTLAEHILVETQKIGGQAILLDYEATFDAERAKVLGLDIDQLIVLQTPTVEDGLEALDHFLQNVKDNELKDTPVVVVWDTIAAAPERAEKKGDRYGEGIARKARLLHEAFRRLTIEMAARDVTLVLVNQLITNINAGRMYGGPTDSAPGGTGTRFHASLQLKLYRGRPFEIKEKDRPVGIRVKAKIVKSKVPGSLPRSEVIIPIYNATGIDDVLGMLEYLAESKSDILHKKRGGYYVLKVPRKKEPVKFRLKQRRKVFQDPALLEALQEAVRQEWGSGIESMEE